MGITRAQRIFIWRTLTLVAPLLLLAASGWWLFGRHQNEEPEIVSMMINPVEPQATPGASHNADVSLAVEAAIGKLQSALEGITDAPSAEAALPTLKETTAELDQAGGLVEQLPAEGRTALANNVMAARPAIDRDVSKALAAPGAAELAKPAIDTILKQLDAIAKS
jgi:hypothetical protein